MPGYRNRGQMAQQMEDLLRHYEQHEALTLSANDILQMALDGLWQRKVGILLPEPAHIVGYTPITLARPVLCEDCGRELLGEAWRIDMSDGSHGALICRACMEN